MKKKRIFRTAVSLFMAVILAGQGTGPVFVYAKDMIENAPREVTMEQPEAISDVQEVLDEGDVAGTDGPAGQTEEPKAEEPQPEKPQPEKPKTEESQPEEPKAEEPKPDAQDSTENPDARDESADEKKTEEGGKKEPVELKEPEDYYPIPEEPEGELIDYNETSKTYKQADGEYLTQFGGYMGVYEDTDGELKKVDNNLVEPKTRSAEGAVVNQANDYQVTLPKNITEQAGVVLEKEGKRLEIIPLSGDYSHPVIKDNAVLYNQVQEGIDVQYTILDNNIKEDIVLQKKAEIPEYKYELVLDGLEAVEEDGVICLYEEGSREETIYVLEAPIMMDAAGAISMNITLSLQTEEGRTYLVVTPDQEWLNSEERQYPVRIDPTTVNVTREYFSLIDVEQGAPDTIVGDNGFPYVGYDDGIVSGNLITKGAMLMICRTYVRVNYDFAEIPKDSKIDSATFSVSQLTNFGDGSAEFGLYRVDSEWADDITWIHQPAEHTFIDVQNSKPVANEYINYNVKDMINDWIQGTYPNHGMVLKAIDEASGLEAAMQCEVMNNKNSPYGPKLTVEWSSAEDPFLRDMPLEDLSIQLRPMTEKSPEGKLQFDAVFADGLSKSKSVVEYYLSPDEDDAEIHLVADAQGEYKYPDNTEFLAQFPNATKYKSKDSNWQSALYAGLKTDKLYKIKAIARKDDKSSGEKESDSFVIYKVKQFDTFPKIAKYYGVPLVDIMKDNHVQDTLVIENNTIFIRNPKTNEPYSPEPLSDIDKRKIDGALMGRGLHCEFGFEPVNLNTGNFFMEQEDAVLPELNGEFSIRRSYNSKGTDQNSMFGRGWSFEYGQALSKAEDGSIIFSRGDGSYLFMTPKGDGTYQAPEGYQYQLKEVSYENTDHDYIGYELTDSDKTVWSFDKYGMLRYSTDIKGFKTTLDYDEEYNLKNITTPSGKVFSFEQDKQGYITAITLPDGSKLTYQYDKHHNLTEAVNANGSSRTYAYDKKNRMISWKDENGNTVVTNEYDKENRVTAQTDANGNQSTFAYADGQTTTTDNEGNVTVYHYDDQYRTTSIEYPDGSTKSSTYEGNQLSSQTTAKGTASYTYDGNGNVLSETREDGAVRSYTYNELNLPVSVTDYDGAVTTMQYDGAGNVTSVTSPNGAVTTFAYDELHRLVSQTNGNGVANSYGYDGPNLVSYTDGNGNTWGFSYDAMGRQTGMTDPLGHTVSKAYDAAGNLISETAGDGSVTSYAIDQIGNILSITDPVGNTTGFEYDAMYNITKGILPNGGEMLYTYNKNGLEISQTDPKGNVIVTEYDSMGRIISKTTEEAGTISFTYDAAGNMTGMKDGRGYETISEYNSLGLVTKTTDAKGNVLTYKYDSAGHITETNYPDGSKASYTYDAIGNLVSETDVMGVTTSYTYDALGQLLTATDDSGRALTYSYDKNGNLLSATKPDGSVVSFTYDAANQQTAVTDEEGRTEAYGYDAAGRVAEIKDAAGYTNTMVYNGNGELLESTDGNGNSYKFTYNALGKMTSLTDSLGNITAMKYDKAGNLKQTIDALKGTTSYQYDSRGKVIKMTDAMENVYTYTYDKTGSNTSMTLPNGDTVTMKYDRLGQLKEVTDVQGMVIKYSYDSMGRMLKAADSEGHSMEYTYDAAGNVTSQTDNLGRTAVYTYDKYGRLITLEEADGSKTSYEYDVMDNIIAVTDAEGHKTTFTYDKAGNQLTMTKSEKAVYQYAYDQRDRVISTTDPMGASTTFKYDGNDNLTEVKDANGSKTVYGYDGNDNLISLTDGRGNTTTYQYDALGRLISEKTPEGAVSEYAYDALSNLTKYKDPMELITEYQYDVVGNMIKEISPKGAETAYAYDKHGNLIRQTDPMGNVTSYEVDQTGNLTKLIQADGGEYTYQYDAADRLKKVTTPLGYVKNFSYDKVDNLVKETDSLKRTSSYTYDKLHHLLTGKDAQDGVNTYTYDERGNLTAETDPLGRTRQYQYDLADRMVKALDPQGKVSEYTYDPVGNLTALTRPGGRTTKLGYDQNSNLTSITDPMGYVTAAVYDKDNRLTEEIDALKQKTQYAYDLNSRITAVTDKTGSTEKYEYDPHGNITTITDKTGVKTQLEYDKNDNLVKVTDPMGGVTTYAYDSMNEMTAFTDALGRTTAYTYDKEGNLTENKDSSGRTKVMTYDESGRLISYVSPSGKKTSYDYDKLNNLIEKSYQDAKGEESDTSAQYAYNAAGERVSMKDTTGKSAYEYDELGRLKKAVNGSGKEITYVYDEADNLKEIIYPDQTKVVYEYDLNDNLIKVTDNNGKATEYKYDALNRMTETIRPNSTKTTVTYDAEDRVTKLVNECTKCGQVISSYAYKYNAQGYIVSEEASELEAGTRKPVSYEDWYNWGGKKEEADKDCCHQEKTVQTNRTYEYDDNWELTRCTEKEKGGKTTVHNYTYDKVGNRTTYEKIEDGVQKEKYQYKYNDANQMISRKNCRIWGDKGIKYEYDGDGNLIKTTENSYDDPVTYEYTAENRLKVVKKGKTVLMAALYDGDGNRVFQIDNTYDWEDCYGDEVLIPESQRTEDKNTPKEKLAELIPGGADTKGYTLTEYINDVTQENTQALAEYNADDSLRQSYTYGENRVSVAKGKETGYYLYDGRASVTGLISDKGALTNSYRYDSYGNLTSGTPDAVNYYGYNAESANTKTGLQYLRARYYDPATGRFISEDTESGTKENPLTRNSYLYVLNNPLNYCDPTGKFFKELWNGVKKAVKKVGNFVNEHVVKPIKKAVSWVADKASSAVKAVSNWWDKVTGAGSSGNKGNGSGGSPSPSAAGYYGNLGGYPGNSGGSSYAAMDLQTKASYMSDQEIGQLENGWGLSGTQLERYQEQRTNVVKTKVKHQTCKADQEKAKTDWERTIKGGLKAAGGVVLTAVGVGFAIGTGGIGGLLIGGAMALFGAADLTEGGQDVYYGAKGSDKKSTNLIKDKVFRGNEDAYYAVEGALNLGILGYGVLGNLNNPNAIKFKTNLTDRAKGVQNSSTADDIFSFERYKETLVKGDVLENSKSIIEGEKLGDKKLIKELTADGSKISDWAKMESTYSYTNEWGTGKIHYYKNIKTGEINYYDAKMKIQAPKDLKSNLINTAVDKDGYWIVELDENLIPIGVRK